MDESRRDFIRKSAVAGGAIWAVPVISTVSTASAQTASPCVCSGSHRGVHASGTLLDEFGVGTVDSGLNGCPFPFDMGPVEFLVPCPTFDAQGCSQSSTITGFTCGPLSMATIMSTATGPAGVNACEDGYSGSTSIGSLAGIPTAPDGSVNQIIPQFTVEILGVDVMINGVFNEQFCDGEFVVRALRLQAAAVVDSESLEATVILAESRISSGCCPC